MADHFQPARAKDLRTELGLDKKDKNFKSKRSTMRKIVANMSLNSVEMLSLFPDVVTCLGINDLEIKRLAMLYLETYAKSRPELATNALPVLVQDTRHNNPLIRSLSLRTISSVPLPSFSNETLRLCKVMAKDDDPLVRVAAVYAMAKVWTSEPEAAEEAGFSRSLNQMLNDKHPRVSATAVSCLLEVASITPAMTITINFATASQLVENLSKCNEWCQIYILRILQFFLPSTEREAIFVLSNSFSRMQHANTAVVLATVRLTIYLLNFINDYKAAIPNFEKTFHTPFALLTSKPPQLQYIMLRNLIILLQSHPILCDLDARIFFSTYNDPTYVKTSKIEVLYSLANEDNAPDIINELYTCAADIDIEASRKAINSLGRLCLKLPNHADECVDRLQQTCNSGAPYIVQEVTIAMQSILRRFPDRYAREFIPLLCDYREDIYNDEVAKVAFLWIVGHYPRESVETEDILVDIISTFSDEPSAVQLSAVTAAVKLFIAHPQATKHVVPKIFEVATEEAQDPDLRDRAFMYWRLLSHDPHKAHSIVLSRSTDIELSDHRLSDAVLEELDHSLGYLSSLYLKPPSRMFRVAKPYELPRSPLLVPRNKYKTPKAIVSSPASNYGFQPPQQPQSRPQPPPTRQMSALSIDPTGASLTGNNINGNGLNYPPRFPMVRVGSGNTQYSGQTMTPVPDNDSPFMGASEKLIDI